MASDPQAPGHHRVFSYVERGFYGLQLERVYRFFPRSQVLCLRAEDLKNAPGSTLNRVCAFLGVEPMREIRPLQANVGVQPAAGPDREDWRYLTHLFADDMHLFSSLSGLDTSRWSA